MKKDYSITFFYYEDIHAVVPFYEDVLKFELVLDQGLARIYRIAENCYFGIVDGNRGHLKHQEKSAVLLTIVSQDVEGWHARLKEIGVAGQSEMLRGNFCEHFFFEDPAGYAIEIQRFHNPDVAKLFQ
jgi:predicted enzyme related to lactoylglutathione lyase